MASTMSDPPQDMNGEPEAAEDEGEQQDRKDDQRSKLLPSLAATSAAWRKQTAGTVWDRRLSHSTREAAGDRYLDTRRGEGTMPNVFEVLSQDHEQVKQMLTEFEAGPAATTGASERELTLRTKMAEQLIIDESRHEAAEEMYFWPAVRERIPGGGQFADTAISQEQEAKQVLARLDKLDAGNPEFEALLGEFIAAAREHIAFEETQVWPALRSALTGPEAAELGDKIAQAKKTAPTRPHPHTPPTPGVLKAAGPAAAAVDRARDAATGRGQD
jgi:hemerythrin-like domain-containing protein